MDLEKLRALVELSRVGTMAAVATATGYGTSAVSQQLAALERQVGVPLLEAAGRGVRLTPAGRRLADRGRDILAAVTAAEMELAARSEPHGVVRIAGFVTALRRYLLPVMVTLQRTHPGVQLQLHEGEPTEVLSMLDDDLIDLGFVYDYSLVPRAWRHPHSEITSSAIALAVPPDAEVPDRIRLPSDLDAFRDSDWISNSRDAGDDELSARLCALAGWTPTIRHRADTLDMVAELVNAGQGVSVMPTDAPESTRVRTVPLDLARIERRVFGVVRAGTREWPATTLVLDQVLAEVARSSD